jgi:hypothetical protein
LRLLGAAVFLFFVVAAAADCDATRGTIQGKATPAATGLPVYQVHGLFFIREV